MRYVLDFKEDRIKQVNHVSDTAYWMAWYRAVETEKQNALFKDPLAKVLLDERGQKISESMGHMSKFSYWILILRTILIDEYLLKFIDQGYTTIINLGAGLDTRPYRLNLQKHIKWIEVDYPSVIELKNDKLKMYEPTCDLERIKLDLSQREFRQNLFSELNSKYGPSIILTEGVVPYLNESAVSELATDLNSHSNFKLWISEYYTPSVYSRYQSKEFVQKMGNSPFQFFPQNWFEFFKKSGWEQQEIHFLYDEGEKRNRKFPLPWWAKILMLFVNKQKILENVRVNAYVVYKKISN